MAPITKLVYGTVFLMMASSAVAAPLDIDRRQIGGEATALYGIVNNVDNGSGYALENFEDGIANGLNPGSGGDEEYGEALDGNGSSGGGAPSGGAPGGGPPPPPRQRRMAHVRRQGNKIANGLGPLVGDLGQKDMGNALENTGDQEDSTLTAGAGDLGTTAGELEEGTLSEAGYGAGEVVGDALGELKGGIPAGGAPAGGI